MSMSLSLNNEYSEQDECAGNVSEIEEDNTDISQSMASGTNNLDDTNSNAPRPQHWTSSIKKISVQKKTKSGRIRRCK